MAQSAEKNGQLQKAAEMYRKALLASGYKRQVTDMEESLERVQLKIKTLHTYRYELV